MWSDFVANTYATHHGAAALHIVIQQAQSAQSLFIPQPVLRWVQHTVTAQNLKHTDELYSDAPTHTANDTHPPTTTHTLSESPIHFHLPLCFPFRRMGSIDLSLGHLFQFKCPQLGIRNLSTKQSQIVSSLRWYFHETLGWNVKSRSWLFIMFFSVII